MTDAKPQLHLVPAAGAADIRATVELIEAARRYLIDARELPDIRSVMEMATVAKDAGRRAAKLAEARGMTADVVEAANDAANDAAAVRNEAQAKAGELLRSMTDDGRRAERGRPEKMSQPATFSEEAQQPAPDAAERGTMAATLDDLGVSRSESSRWQQVAAVPADVRQEYVEETKAGKGEVSTAGLLRYARERTQPTIHHPVAPRSAAPADDPLEAAPALNGYDIHEAVWNLVFEVHRIYGILVTNRHYEGLVDELGEFERDELLTAVRDIAGWLGNLQTRLEAPPAPAGTERAQQCADEVVRERELRESQSSGHEVER